MTTDDDDPISCEACAATAARRAASMRAHRLSELERDLVSPSPSPPYRDPASECQDLLDELLAGEQPDARLLTIARAALRSALRERDEATKRHRRHLDAIRATVDGTLGVPDNEDDDILF